MSHKDGQCSDFSCVLFTVYLFILERSFGYSSSREKRLEKNIFFPLFWIIFLSFFCVRFKMRSLFPLICPHPQSLHTSYLKKKK